MNNESVGKKIVEALKKQAENIDINESVDTTLFDEPVLKAEENFTNSTDDFFAEPIAEEKTSDFFSDIEEEKESLFAEPSVSSPVSENDSFEMPANIAVLKKLSKFVL